MCKAKSCTYWKSCLVKRECMDFCYGDYMKAPDKAQKSIKTKKNTTK